MAQSPFTNQCCFQNLPLDWDVCKDSTELHIKPSWVSIYAGFGMSTTLCHGLKAGPARGGAELWGLRLTLGQEGSRRGKSRVQGVLHQCLGPHHLPCTLMLLPWKHMDVKAPWCSCAHLLQCLALCTPVRANPYWPDSHGASISLVFMWMSSSWSDILYMGEDIALALTQDIPSVGSQATKSLPCTDSASLF